MTIIYNNLNELKSQVHEKIKFYGTNVEIKNNIDDIYETVGHINSELIDYKQKQANLLMMSYLITIVALIIAMNSAYNHHIAAFICNAILGTIYALIFIPILIKNYYKAENYIEIMKLIFPDRSLNSNQNIGSSQQASLV